jgi:hypothetical protein
MRIRDSTNSTATGYGLGIGRIRVLVQVGPKYAFIVVVVIYKDCLKIRVFPLELKRPGSEDDHLHATNAKVKKG